MSYTYNEPNEVPTYEPLPEGDYPFEVKAIQPTYTNEKGTFILPVEIHLVDTNRNIKTWLSAGISKKGDPFDMIAPFLKCIRCNPAIGEEPDFSSRNLLGASGMAHIKEEPYKGDDAKYQGMSFPTVKMWLYDRELANATLSGGPSAKERTYGKGVDPDDEIPF